VLIFLDCNRILAIVWITWILLGYNVLHNFPTWIVNVTIAMRSAATIPSSILTLAFPELNLTSELFFLSHIPLLTQDYCYLYHTGRHFSTMVSWNPQALLVRSHCLASVPLFSFTTRTGFRTIHCSVTVLSNGYSATWYYTRGPGISRSTKNPFTAKEPISSHSIFSMPE
jgi:hypothetical protein